MKRALLLLCLSFAMTACREKIQVVEWISTSPGNEWKIEKYNGGYSGAAFDITVDSSRAFQSVEGFGACFNELGWTSLNLLSETDRESVMEEMFAPGRGAGFTLNRMPLGANDFSRNWYSYCEKEGDFNLETFSIANDYETLIPFIRNAQKYYPQLRLWASPWSPPAWMKYNRHYACRPNERYNDLPGDPSLDREGENMFIQDDAYFAAYADYFARFIDAYAKEGIPIFAVAPQNEFNSCQIFPSCTWEMAGMNRFVGRFLGPKMADKGVEIIFGTMERPDHRQVDTLLQDPFSSRFISWVGFQWAGKKAIEAIHKNYPDMKLIQTESECGDGSNSWEYCFYTWDLMKHYFRNGASAYQYWNISLESDALSRWGWKQNSLVSVDKDTKTFKYNPEYYLMKHFSRHVRPGAKMVAAGGNYEDLLAFVNEDRSLVLLMANKEDKPVRIGIEIAGKNLAPELSPRSINTLILK